MARSREPVSNYRFVSALGRGFRSLGPNAIWVTAGVVASQGSTLVGNMFIANRLGKSAFGEFVIVLSTVQATAAFASLGLAYTVTRYLAELRHKDLARASALLNLFSRLSWFVAVAAALILALSATGIASRVLEAPVLGLPLLIAAASTVFTLRNGFLTGALSGMEAFRALGISGVLSGCCYLIFTTTGAALWGIPGAAWGLALSAALQCALMSYALRAEKRRQAFSSAVASLSSERALLLRFALPGSLSGISTTPVLWGVQALLARRPMGFDDLAVYAVGLNLLTMVLFVPIVLNGVAMSWINRTHALQGEVAYRSALRTNVGVTLATVSVALLGVVLLGPLLLRLYGREFLSGYTVLALLLAASLPEALTTALNQSLQARERMWEALLAINLPRDLVIITAAFVLIPRYGAVGAASAYLAGRLVAFTTMCFLVRHEVRRAPALAPAANAE